MRCGEDKDEARGDCEDGNLRGCLRETSQGSIAKLARQNESYASEGKGPEKRPVFAIQKNFLRRNKSSTDGKDGRITRG